MKYQLTAGTTYLLEARFYNTSNVGSMKVKMEKIPAPTAITLDPSGDYTEGLFGDRYIYVSLEPEGSEDIVSYSTDHPDILSVREDGYVCGIAPGTATVTATTGGGLTASITVTVSDAIDMALDTEYTVSPATCRTGSFRFTPAETGMYRFYSYDASVNTYYRIYNAQGNLLYYGGDGWPNEFSADYELTAGQTYYCTAVNSSYSSLDSFKVKMVKLTSATGMTLDQTSASGYAAEAIWLNPVFAPDNAILENVSWVSSDPTVASVDDSGKVELLSVGPASNLFGEGANYYVTYVIEDWPQAYYDIPVFVTVTWYGLDGEPMTYANRTITLSDGM